VHHYPPLPGFAEPPVIALVDLDEGLRFVADVDPDGPAPLEIGATVEVFFVTQDDGWALPRFRTC
jgi:uncharacterized OB-fold protein